MKHQQVVVDYLQMLKTSFLYVSLAFFGWVLIKLLQAVFLLPSYLERNQRLLAEAMKKHNITEEDLKNIPDDYTYDGEDDNEGAVAEKALEPIEQANEDKKTI